MKTPHTDPAFDQFWAKYPRKEGKLAAKREWDRIHPTGELVERMLATLAWQCEQWDDPHFIPHPRTWLHQGRWDDEPMAVARSNGSLRTAGNEAALQAFVNRK
jgi:hypothetical protein